MTQEEQDKQACTVTQAMNLAKRGLEQIRLAVVGEICELSDKPGYKAVYFTVRDETSVMPCIIWRNVYNASGVQLANGKLVEMTGTFSAYPARGSLQFSVRKVNAVGEGNIRVQVAQLARKLEAEGLMDASRKRRIPALPQRIGVITSPRGKAIRDVMRTLRRRYPLGEVMVFGVPVEGDGAARYMCEALEVAQSTQPAPDVILLVRGGGAYETMMPYNDESLARAIAACTIPIVTGIGHEPDNFIADMVADRRFSTPGTAAEGVAMSVDELAGKVMNATKALDKAYNQRLEALRYRIGRLAGRPLWNDPNYLLGDYLQDIDNAQGRLARALPGALQQDKTMLEELGRRLGRAIPDALERQSVQLAQMRVELDRAAAVSLSLRRREVEASEESLRRVGGMVVAEPAKQLALAAARLDALSPLKTLSRGYSIAYASDGASIVKSVEGVAAGDKVEVRVEDGRLECTVDAVKQLTER